MSEEASAILLMEKSRKKKLKWKKKKIYIQGFQFISRKEYRSYSIIHLQINCAEMVLFLSPLTIYHYYYSVQEKIKSETEANK